MSGSARCPLRPMAHLRVGLALTGAVLLSATLALAQPPAPAASGEPAEADDLSKVYYRTVGDARRGDLYPLLAKLMDARMALAAAQRALHQRAVVAARGQAEDGLGLVPGSTRPGGTAEAATAPPPRQKRWAAVLDGPAVEREKLAFAHFMAREHAKAMVHYEALRRRDPGNAHFLLMLALCHKNLGRDREARDLLDRTDASDAAARGWADWMIGMIDLAGGTEVKP